MTSAPQSPTADPELRPVLSSDLHTNGVATAAGGRVFSPVQPRPGSDDPQVVEVRDGAPVPYPDAAWNSGGDPARSFVAVNAVRIDPGGRLWIVDRGAPAVGAEQVPGGAKLVVVDLASDRVIRVVDLSTAVRERSFVDDVRFNGRMAYLTDAGTHPALIVLDLETGATRRLLEDHPSVVAQKPLRAEGRELRDPDGQPVVINADQLEVSPDGRWFYYQPCCGGMSRIQTHFLDDPTIGPNDVERHVERFADTPSTGGTAMDADGTIYLSDTDRCAVLTISPDGAMRTLVDDPRLLWVDAMWIDDDGQLLMPAVQLNRMPDMNGGENAVDPPLTVWGAPLGLRPDRRH